MKSKPQIKAVLFEMKRISIAKVASEAASVREAGAQERNLSRLGSL